MRKTIFGLSIGLFLAVVVFACVQIYRVDSSLRALRSQVAHQGEASFTLARLDPHHAATAGFEPVAAPSSFVGGAAFAGSLYLAGPGGIAVYREAAAQLPALTRQLRPGLELPPAPVTALAVGHLRGETAATLLAGTQGEGVLLISADPAVPVRQLRPADAAARDVTAVLALGSGGLLIGTRRAGLLLFDGETLRPFQDGAAASGVTALAGSDSDLWIGTRDRGLLHAHAGTVEALNTAAGMPDDQITALALSAAGLFAGTPLGTAQIEAGHVTRILAPGVFAASLAAYDDTLLVASVDQGIRIVALRGRGVPHPPIAAADAHRSPSSFFRSGDSIYALQDGALQRRERGAWQTLAAPQQALATATSAHWPSRPTAACGSATSTAASMCWTSPRNARRTWKTTASSA